MHWLKANPYTSVGVLSIVILAEGLYLTFYSNSEFASLFLLLGCIGCLVFGMIARKKEKGVLVKLILEAGVTGGVMVIALLVIFFFVWFLVHALVGSGG